MLILPDTVKDERDVKIFFQGVRQGITTRDCHLVKKDATREGLLHDLGIMEKQAIELISKPPLKAGPCTQCRGAGHYTGVMPEQADIRCPRCKGSGRDPIFKEK